MSEDYRKQHRPDPDSARRHDVRRIVRAVRRGLITPSEGIIDLAALDGVDVQCEMGECTHAPAGA